MTMFIPWTAFRSEDRRTYRATAAEAAALFACLYETDDPHERAELLRAHATCETRMADLHEAAAIDPPALAVGRDLVPLPDLLRASAALFRLVAGTEEALLRSTWTPVAALDEGSRFIHENRTVRVIAAFPNLVAPHLVHVVYDDGDSVVLGAGETVRASGPDRFAVVDQALEQGADVAEVLAWRQLATTRDRDRRAELLTHIAELAAARFGWGVASGLLAIADTEVHIASDPGGPVPRLGLVLSHGAGR